MRYVKTDYDGCPYITAGKAYILYVDKDGGHWVACDDTGDELYMQIHKDENGKEFFKSIIKGTWTECDSEGQNRTTPHYQAVHG